MVRHEEEYQLRFDSIDLMIEMCTRVPKIAAHVGAIKELIERLTDLSLEGYRYERISQSLMLLINDPKIRIFFRPSVELNKIFAIFTRADGVDEDPKPAVMARLKQQ